MDIQRELKNDLTSITGVIELQDGIYLPLEQVENILIKRLEQVKKLTIPVVVKSLNDKERPSFFNWLVVNGFTHYRDDIFIGNNKETYFEDRLIQMYNKEVM